MAANLSESTSNIKGMNKGGANEGKSGKKQKAGDPSQQNLLINEEDKNLELTDTRDQWGNGYEFVLACVGFAVGLGNIWRFPYLCYKNGGGAFLIPYLLYVICGGVPMLFLEVGLGQYMRAGPVAIWNICPIFKGIGIGSTVMNFYTNIYYIVVLCWALHYFISSFTLGELPWSTCDNPWNSEHCITPGLKQENGTITSLTNELRKDSTLEYWERKVLNISGGLEQVGDLQIELVGTLALAWILVYGCIFKGVHSSGKVVYFTALMPYVILVILFIRGVTLPGAADGLLFYITPDFAKLKKSQVWIDAGTQVFYSYACTFGGMIALGSYNKYHRNYVRDCTFIACVNTFSSLFGGCVIFSVLGYMSYASGLPIDKVAESGPGLAFIVYPKAVSLMPMAPLWAVAFFFMIFLIAIDSQFVGVEAFLTAIMDQVGPKVQNMKYSREIISAGLCGLNFIAGLSMVSNGGMYVFQLFDYYCASGMVLLTLTFSECVAISWFYGTEKWAGHVKDMTGHEINPFMKLCWKFITPLLSMGLLAFAIIQYSPLNYNNVYVYPTWGQFVGLAMGFSSIIWIPLYFFYALITAPGGKVAEKFKMAKAPQMNHQEEIKMAQERNRAIKRGEFSAIPTVESQLQV